MSARRLVRDTVFKFQMKMWDRLLPLLSYVRHKDTEAIWRFELYCPPATPPPPLAKGILLYSI